MQGDESDDDGWDPLDGIMEEVGTGGAQCRHAGSSSSFDRAQMVLQEPADQQKPFDEFEYERLDDEDFLAHPFIEPVPVRVRKA